MTMDISKLASFVAVFNNRSFTKAAAELGLSQPTVSEHIRSIEEELGCALFDRLHRNIVPTHEAEGIYQKALSIIEDADALKDTADRMSGSVAGTILVGASTIPGTYMVPMLFQKFRAMHPEVSLEVRIGDSQQVTQWVQGNEIVMGCVGAIMEPERLDYAPFADDEMILVASAGLMKKKRIELKDIAGLPFVIRERGSGTRKTMERFLESNGIAPRSLKVAAVLGSTECVKQAVKSAMGVSFVSRVAVKDELACGALREIPIEGARVKREFYIVTHKKRALPPKYSAFRDYLIGQR